MRIAVIDTTLMRSPTGGGQTFLGHLTTALGSSGHQIDVISEEGPETMIAERIRAAGARIHTDVWPRRTIPEDRASRLAARVQGLGVDAFVVSISPDAGWLALPLLHSDIVTAAIVHNDSPAFYRPMAHYAAFVDRAVGVSMETHRHIVTTCNVPAGRARHIPYGVPRLSLERAATRWNTPREGPLRIGYVGRVVTGQKRVQDIPLLLRELDDRGVDFQLDVVGGGDASAWLQEEVARGRSRGRVRFWGWLPSAAVTERLLELDVLVMLSDVEGLPLALLEAMAHAVLPVVTQTRSGNPEVISDGQNGYLMPIGDVRAFADRLQALARDSATLRRLREAAWTTSEHYSVERMARAWLSCLNRDRLRAPRPPGPFPIMLSCQSIYPRWLRRLKWRVVGPPRTAP